MTTGEKMVWAVAYVTAQTHDCDDVVAAARAQQAVLSMHALDRRGLTDSARNMLEAMTWPSTGAT